MEFASFLQADLTKYADDYETGTRFLAMLAGPFYPILHIVAERLVVSCLEGLNVEIFLWGRLCLLFTKR